MTQTSAQIPERPALIMLYRWRLRAGSEEQFIADWSTVTRILRDERGSMGSRLHQGDDGLWYAYAQWPDAAAIERAFENHVDEIASERMRDAIEERFPPLKLTPVADYLV
jgi:quinol monooxygenase YgiN